MVPEGKVFLPQIGNLPLPVRWSIYAAVIALILTFGTSSSSDFLYAMF